MNVKQCFDNLCSIMHDIEQNQGGVSPHDVMSIIPQKRDLDRDEIRSNRLWNPAGSGSLQIYECSDGEVHLFRGWYDRCRTHQVRPDGNIAVVHAYPESGSDFHQEFRWLDER